MKFVSVFITAEVDDDEETIDFWKELFSEQIRERSYWFSEEKRNQKSVLIYGSDTMLKNEMNILEREQSLVQVFLFLLISYWTRMTEYNLYRKTLTKHTILNIYNIALIDHE